MPEDKPTNLLGVLQYLTDGLELFGNRFIELGEQIQAEAKLIGEEAKRRRKEEEDRTDG